MNSVDTVQIDFEQAVAHHSAGRMAQAERLYKQVLSRRPTHFDAMHNLGVLALQAGRNDIAVELLRRAVSLDSNSPQAHSNLGITLKNLGETEAAIASLRRAIELDPGFAEAHSTLADALVEKEQIDEAIAEYRKAIALNPNLAEAHYNFGTLLKDNVDGDGDFDEAIAELQRAVALKPDFADAFNNLGNALHKNRDYEAAVAAFRRAIELRPDFVDALGNLGVALNDQGQRDEAVSVLRREIALRPDNAEAHNNLGVVLREMHQYGAAADAIRRAIALRPDYVEAHNNYGLAVKEMGRLEEAAAAFRQAIAVSPPSTNTRDVHKLALSHANLANCLKDQGVIEQSIAAYRKAIELDPRENSTGSNMLLTLQYTLGNDPAAMAQEHQRWNIRHALPLRKFIKAHPNDRGPDRRLRIGYVSGDFKQHVVGRLAMPLMERRDRGQVEVFCYSNVPTPDSQTERFRALSDHWRDIARASDEKAAEQVREDKIDILIDLAGHTGGHRLTLFARKPAPIQLSYVGYPGSTGVSAIDYRVSDRFADPPDLTDPTDNILRVAQSNWCFNQSDDYLPVQPTPPMTEKRVTTFGCLNNYCKVSNELLDLWVRVLASVPKSRLMIRCPVGADRQRVLDKFAADSSRIEFIPYLALTEYLSAYFQIDITLDTFPYHGTATTIDSLWMGLPVVTLAGKTHVARVGVSLLTNGGMPELIADTKDQYVQFATDLANDPQRLQSIRQNTRARMLASPLMDAVRFNRDMEAVYRQAWQTWCATGETPE